MSTPMETDKLAANARGGGGGASSDAMRGRELCSPRGCSICRDEAVRMIVLSIDGQMARARALASASETFPAPETGELMAEHEVAVNLVPGVREGDHVLVHQGVAIARFVAKPAAGSGEATSISGDHEVSRSAGAEGA
ncbi:MAG: hypothetical protein SFZ23_07340 [Planctomycetota bacterium]|nr:hypothetical protein [Planctomycetota bacterium]